MSNSINRNKIAGIIGIVGGIFILVVGINGVVFWSMLSDIVKKHLIDNVIVGYVFSILISIASLGGIAVIIGSLLIWKNMIRVGKFLIALGVGTGIIGVILMVVVWAFGAEEKPVISWIFIVGFVGIILSVVTRVMAKKQPQSQLCPHCGNVTIYVPQTARYYCGRCNIYI